MAINPEDTHAVRVQGASSARDRVAQEILRRGPVTAAELADTLQVSAAGVRRHLELLEAAGLVAEWQAPASNRGRGRPARAFVLTDAGHAAMTSGYDTLATQALRYLADTMGPDAVRHFADQRAEEIIRRHQERVHAAGNDPAARAKALAGGLTGDGYAASVRQIAVGVTPPPGVQLCQGHCPVQEVAKEFPQLCEAEAAAFSDLLGVHVQRLATLANGEHVCTTYVPVATHEVAPPRRESPSTTNPPATKEDTVDD